MDRVIWIVLDSVGCGEAPDADKFGDVGSNTIKSAAAAIDGFDLPNMRRIGYGNIDGIEGVRPVDEPIGAYGKLAEKSMGKDTTTGHWEMAGIITPTPFPTYPDGFPDEVMDAFMKEANVDGYYCNKPYSGTKVIYDYWDEHMKTGYPIIYTSGDSVFQIAAHEDVIPVERLYELCRAARKILTGPHAVGRVIARPFIGTREDFTRTSNRRDFSLKPSDDNILMYLKNAGHNVAAVGKIEDIFAGSGITDATHTKNNMDGMDVTFDYMKKINEGLIYTNLVEFDSTFGHRRDAVGYANGLLDFDRRLGELIELMTDDDLLIITADHGCDPSFKGSDHTREYVPLLMYRHGMKGVNLGASDTFADIAQTISEMFGLKRFPVGKSYLSLIEGE